MPYDDAEAKDLLSRYADKNLPNATLRVEAARRLIDDLAKLHGALPGLKIDKDKDEDGGAEMRFGGRLVLIAVHPSDGRIMVASPRPGSTGLDYHEVQGLRLDLLANPPELVGERPDDFRLPVPGQPTRPRSALAVVVKAALDALRE